MVKNVKSLPEKVGYLVKIWFIWFMPACTAHSANPTRKTWFRRHDEPYIHGFAYFVWYFISVKVKYV